MDLDIRKDSEIDKCRLEYEAQKLPSVISRYHEAITEQSRLVDNLKFKLEKEEAVARNDARSSLALNSTGSNTKPTQAMVDDAVTQMPAILQLRKEVAEEERELAYLKGCISILETKRKSLDNLVQLWVHDYYSTVQLDKNSASGKYVEADIKRRMSVDYSAINEEETDILNTRRK